MKKPILNQFQRQMIYLDTFNGAWNELYIEILNLRRAIEVELEKALNLIEKWLEDNETSKS